MTSDAATPAADEIAARRDAGATTTGATTGATTGGATTPGAPAPRSGEPGRLGRRVQEARERLSPARLAIPEPRAAEGVVPIQSFGTPAPPKDLVTALDALGTRLAGIENGAGEDAPRALARAVALVAVGVPEEGWSSDDGFTGETLVAASALAGSLHDDAAALLERLDAEDRPGSAVEIDAVVTSLRVARMVLDLESFAVDHG